VNQEDWQRRIHDLIDQYHPDLLYSDGGLPFGAVGEATVAHLYNTSIAAHGGKLEAVYNCKKNRTGEFDASTCVQDVERGLMTGIQPYPWQTDTSNGGWFYNAKDKYKSTADVLHELTDIVSKNGNLLLNIVLKPDGTLPPESKELLDGLSAWMAVNSESIFGTRPWVVYGEGPTAVTGGALREQSRFTAQDIRFTTKAGVLYAFCLGVPRSAISIKALAKNNPYGVKGITGISLLGGPEKIDWQQGDNALVIQPAKSWPTVDEVVFKIDGALPPS
jgi:alpha-L-fucosidase